MNYTHVAHDCVVGNETVFSNNASLAGHVIVGDYTIFGGFVKVAQFVKLAPIVFLLQADIGKDVLPYVIAGGDLDTAKHSLRFNRIVKRHGFSEAKLAHLKDAYNIILRKELTVVQAIPELEAMLPACPEVQLFVDMLNQSERGILRLR